MTGNDDKLVWKKSSYSNGSGECVEVALDADGVQRVRDSKMHGGPMHSFTPDGWIAFVESVKAGEFDA